MDIVAGLAAATQAIGLVKELKEIDKGVDEAAFKLKIAELVEVLADTKIALADAKETLAEKQREIRRLEKVLDEKHSGPVCPLCTQGTLKTVSVRPHPQFGVMGHQEHALSCDNAECNHKETRKVDPNA